MSVPVRHHYVPRSVLKNFSDKAGWLHGFDTRFPARGVFRSKPENIFVERHLYSLHGADGGRDPAGEVALGRLEDAVAPIVDRIIRAARERRRPRLTAEERATWDQFFIVQWSRTPDTRSDVVPDDMLKKIIEAAADDLLESYPERADEIGELRNPSKMAEMAHDARVYALFDDRPLSRAALARRGIAIVTPGNPKWSFAIGSRPVVKLGIPGATHIDDPRTEIWMPLAHDVAVGIGSFEEAETGLVLNSSKPVRELNAAVVLQSSAFATRSAALTQSLAQPR